MIPVYFRLEQEAKEEIDRLSREDGAPIAHHFRKAVEMYIESKKQSGSANRVGIGKDR